MASVYFRGRLDHHFGYFYARGRAVERAALEATGMERRRARDRAKQDDFERRLRRYKESRRTTS
jgi:hypothetical protein